MKPVIAECAECGRQAEVDPEEGLCIHCWDGVAKRELPAAGGRVRYVNFPKLPQRRPRP